MCLLELEYNFECDLGKLGVARAQGEDDILGAILLVTDVDQKQRLDSPMRLKTKNVFDFMMKGSLSQAEISVLIRNP